MKKLFIAGALMLSAFTFTSMQAKGTVVQADGSYIEPSRICRYYAIGEANSGGFGYGTTEWQYEYLDNYNECMSQIGG